ncbi:hypothetical protein CKJ84_08645 [Corynebacterium sp. NML 120412]|nr:hypothetical protein CKJ84_08645 [Corynebacterium sp. NML 120412]
MYASYIQIFLKDGKAISELDLPSEGSQVDYYWIREDGRIFNTSVQHVNMIDPKRLAQEAGVPSKTFEGDNADVFKRGIAKQLKYDQDNRSIKSTTTASFMDGGYSANGYWNWIFNEKISPDVAKYVTDVTIYKSDQEGNPLQGATKWKVDFDKETGFATTANRRELSYLPHEPGIDAETKDAVWRGVNNTFGFGMNAFGSYTIEYQLEEGAENLANSPDGKRIDTISWISVDFTDKWPKAFPGPKKEDGGAEPTLLKNTLKSDFLNIADSDGDGLTDDYERDLGTDSSKADTDGDGVRDDVEVLTDDTDPVDAKSFKPAAPQPAKKEVPLKPESLSGTITREQDKDLQGKDIPLLDVTNAEAAPVKIVAVPTNKLNEDADGNLNYDAEDAVDVASLDDVAAIQEGKFKSGELTLEKDTEYTIVAESPNGERTKGGAFKATSDVSDKTSVDVSGVKPVEPTGDKQGTGVKVTNSGADTKVSAKDEDGNKVPAEIDGNGNVVVTPGEGVDGPIEVTVEDPDLDGGKATVEVPVNGHEKDRDDNDTATTAGDDAGAKADEATQDKPGAGVSTANSGGDTTVAARDEDGENVPAGVDDNGIVEVTPGEGVDGPIEVTVEDPDLDGGKATVEVPVNGHEKDRDDNGSDKTSVDVSGVKPVEPTGDKQGTGVKVTNSGADTKVSAKDEDGNKVPAEIDGNGNVVVTPGEGVDGPIEVTVEDPDLDGGKATVEVPVNGHEKDRDDNGSDKTSVDVSGVKPVEPTGDKQGTGVKGTNPGKDTKGSATDEGGKELPASIYYNGNVVVTPGEDGDGPITVTVEDPDLDGGKATVEVPVNGHEKDRDDNGSDKTSVDVSGVKPVEPTGDKQGTGVKVTNSGADTKVSAKDEDGNKVPAEIDGNGNVVVTPGEGVDGPIEVTVEDPDLDGGKATVEVPVNGHEKDRDDNGSDKTSVDVSGVKPVEPTGDKQGTGVKVTNSGADTKVSAKDEDGNKVPAEIDGNGNVVVTPGEGVDGPIEVTVEDPDLDGGKATVEVPVNGHEKDRDDNGSDKTSVDVSGVKPVEPTGDKQGTGVKVTNSGADTKVSAKDEDGNKVPAEIDGNGNVVVTPGEGVDGPIEVTVEDPDLDGGKATVEVPVNGHEKDRDDNGSDKTSVDVSGVKPVEPTGDKQGTGVKVTNSGADTKVSAKDEDGNKVPAEIDGNGNVVVTPGEGVDGPIEVTVEDPDLDGGKATVEVPVNGHEKDRDDNGSDKTSVDVSGVKPVEPTGDKQGTGVKVTNSGADTKVSAKDEDGNKVPAEIDGNGNVVVTPGEGVDGPIEVTVEDPDLDGGKATVEVPVNGHEKDRDDNGSDKTSVDVSGVKPVEPTGDKQGTGVKVTNSGADTKVSAKDEDGNKVPAEIDGNGNVVVTPGEGVDGPIEVTVEDPDLDGGKATVEVPVNGHEKDRDDNGSDKTSVDVSGVKPVEPTGDKQGTGVKVTNSGADTKVSAKDEDGNKVPAEIDGNGNVVVTPGEGVDGPIEVTVEDPDLDGGKATVEVPVNGHEKDRDDNGSDKTSVDVSGVKPVEPTGDKQGTGVKVTNSGADTKVSAKDEDGNKVPAEIDGNGNVVVTPGEGVDGPIEVTVEDPDLDGGKATVEVPVNGHEKDRDDNGSDKTSVDVSGVKPVEPTGDKQGTGVKVTNSGADTKVSAKDEDGNKVPAEIDGNGNVVVTPGEGVDGPIEVTVEDPDLDGGKATVEVPVNGHEKDRDDNGSDKTSVDVSGVKPVEPTGDKQGTGVKVTNSGADTKVSAKDEDGNKVPAEIDGNGNVVVTPGEGVDGPIEVTVEDPDLDGGKATVEVPVNGHEKDRDDNGSDKTSVDVSGVKPVEPTGDKQGTGVKVTNSGADTKVSAKDEDGNKVPAEIDGNGNVVVTPGEGVDGPIEVTVEDPDLDGGKATVEVPVNGHEKDRDDNGSDKTSVDVSGVKPVEPTGDKQGTGVKVTNSGADTKVSAKDEDGNKVPAEIDGNGNVVVTPGEGVDGPIEVTVEDPDLDGGKATVEVPVNGHEKDRDDNGSDKTSVDVSGVKPVEPTGDKQGTGVKVTNSGADTKVSAKDEDGNKVPAEIDGNGNVVVTPGEGVDGPIEVTVEDPDLDGGKATVEVPVNGHEKDRDDNGSDKTSVDVSGVKPVEPTGDKQGTGVKVTNSGADTKVSAKDEDGNKVPAEIDGNGNVVVTPGGVCGWSGWGGGGV